ncbi:ThiJ/PfpI domain protein [Paenibacillus curdlanolyticus YK9]|uniref:ThiJ/PfpI domain protein n=1 Tax=Paenibacillus curdlanolyticus YK9 TaxID=717606 RepID=E0IA07_9BACL|nr:DJ-1/PfpI family protein [Paenibacillus curdlanolyticus]EFM10584.1 ThiJ/PfpI domain protein [Paenibacillus curdlanolyticus YK9]
MSGKILILTGDAAEVLEVYYPYYRMLEEGYETDIAAPQQKILNTVCHDFVDDWATYTEKPAHRLAANIAFADVDPSQYAGIIIPGGRAPEFIRNDVDLPRIVRHFLEEDKPVGVICHGAQVFLALKDSTLFQGRTIKAYNASRYEVESLGATYPEENLHVDGNIISGHAWPDLPGFTREFLRAIRRSEAASASAAGSSSSIG